MVAALAIGWLGAVLAAGSLAQPVDWRAKRAKLDAEHAARIKELAEKCVEIKRPEEAEKTRGWIIPRHAGRQYAFLLPSEDVLAPAADAPDVVRFWHKRLLEIRKLYGAGLFDVAKLALDAGDLPVAWQLVYETLREDPDHPGARRTLGFTGAAGKWSPGRQLTVSQPAIAHARLGWRPRTYWRIESEHFSVATNAGAEAGKNLIAELEDLYTAWEQIYTGYWATPVDLAARFQVGPGKGGAFKRRKVVLFKNREEYVAALKPVQPMIEITDGLYLDTDSTVYLYAGEARSSATWRHEATHQLFHEAKGVPRNVGANCNFWVIEGAAMYMESLVAKPGYVVVGGLDASRLQFSRDTAMRGAFYVRQVQFVALSRTQLQEDKNIRRLYSQGAGLAHFLMDSHDGKYRAPFGEYLNLVYSGRDAADSLSKVTGLPFEKMDSQYVDWLKVTDADLAHSPLMPTIRNLCLAQTRITKEGIKQFPAFTELDWGDFSRLPLDDEQAIRILQSPRLSRLWLEQTEVGDGLAPTLGKLVSLAELDLSETKFTDDGLAHLASLKNLKVLWLTGTKITDASIPVLSGLKGLETLELDQTGVSAKGVAALKQALPKWSAAKP